MPSPLRDLDLSEQTPAPSAVPASELLAARWIREARRHEQAAEEISEMDDRGEEQLIHLEIARALRKCAHELLELRQ